MNETLQNIIPPYLTFCSFLFIFSSFLMLTIQDFFPFPFFFPSFFYWTNFFSIVVVSNLEKTKEKKEKKLHMLLCILFILFLHYIIWFYMVCKTI